MSDKDEDSTPPSKACRIVGAYAPRDSGASNQQRALAGWLNASHQTKLTKGGKGDSAKLLRSTVSSRVPIVAKKRGRKAGSAVDYEIARVATSSAFLGQPRQNSDLGRGQRRRSAAGTRWPLRCLMVLWQLQSI